MSLLRPHQISPDGTDGSNVTDGDYVVRVAGGVVTGLVDSTDVATRLLPLTTAINSVPEIVWDANNEIVLTEVPQ